MLSFLRKLSPVTVRVVLRTPAVGDNPMLAPLGSGAYTTAAGPVVGLVLVALTVNAYVMLSATPDAEYVSVDAGTTALVPPGLILMLYRVMLALEPSGMEPLEVGGVQSSLIWPGPILVAARLVGGPGGTTLGVALINAPAPHPELLWARTVNAYVLAFVRPDATKVVLGRVVGAKSAGVAETM